MKRVEAAHGKIEPVKAAKRDPKYSKKVDKTLEETKKKMLACAFMDGARRVHQPLLKDLEQDYSPEEEKHPATLEEALQGLTAHENQHGLNKKCNRLRELQDAESPGLSFVQKIELIEKQVCFKCQKPGHKAHQCKEKKE